MTGFHTPHEWERLKQMFGYRCVCCGDKEGEFEFGRSQKLSKDHIVPVSKGGGDDIRNIQPLCFSCNASKRNWHAFDYRPCFYRRNCTFRNELKDEKFVLDFVLDAAYLWGYSVANYLPDELGLSGELRAKAEEIIKRYEAKR